MEKKYHMIYVQYICILGIYFIDIWKICLVQKSSLWQFFGIIPFDSKKKTENIDSFYQ